MRLIIFNTATISESDVKLLMELISHEINIDDEIANNSPNIVELLELMKINNQLNGEVIRFDKCTVAPNNEKKTVQDVIDEKNIIKLVYDVVDQQWSIVTQDTNGVRFQKKINELTADDEKQPYLAGIKANDLRTFVANKNNFTYTQWDSLKSTCFAHPNPIQEISILLQATLDNPSHDHNKTTEIRQYIKDKLKMDHDTLLIIYSNHALRDVCGNQEIGYVMDQIRTELNQRANGSRAILYIGGGHGWPSHQPQGMLSALNNHAIDQIKNELQSNNICFNAIIFGSCFSASYAEGFSVFLSAHGVMVSSTTSQGGNNYFINTIESIRKPNSNFFEVTQHMVNNAKPNDIKPTGICLTFSDSHTGLNLNKNIGLPEQCVEDEYQYSTDIVSNFPNGKNRFTDDLNERHHLRQQYAFSYFLIQALNKPNTPQQGDPKQPSVATSNSSFWSKALVFGVSTLVNGYLQQKGYRFTNPNNNNDNNDNNDNNGNNNGNGNNNVI